MGSSIWLRDARKQRARDLMEVLLELVADGELERARAVACEIKSLRADINAEGGDTNGQEAQT